MAPQPGALLLASLSEARHHSPAGSHLPQWPFSAGSNRPRFNAAGQSLPWLGSSTHAASSSGSASCHGAHLTTSDFSVSPMSGRQPGLEMHHFLTSGVQVVNMEASKLVNNLSRLAVMHMASQGALQQHLARVHAHNPLRRLQRLLFGSDADGSCSSSGGNAGAHGAGGRGVRAGGHRTAAQTAVQQHVEAAMLAEREMRLQDAAAAFLAAAELEPHPTAKSELLSRCSKQWSDMTYLDHTANARAMEVNRRAIELGTQAVELDPESAYGYVACCVSRGRLALYSDNKTKVSLARAAQDDVMKALALDPRNDIAHHLLGRWHYEMAGVNLMVRTLVRMIYGAALMAGTHQEALQCFKTAAELAPEKIIHRVELARTYQKLGDLRRAVEQYEAALSMEVDDINAHLQKQTAEQVVVQLRQKQYRQQSSPANFLFQAARRLTMQDGC